MKSFSTSLRTLEGAHRKRQEKKRKGGKKELFQLWEKLHEYLNLYIVFHFNPCTDVRKR